jgi:hypothetical protein
MECSNCHHATPILVNENGLCWTCAFPRPFGLAAQQVVAAERETSAVMTRERRTPR